MDFLLNIRGHSRSFRMECGPISLLERRKPHLLQSTILLLQSMPFKNQPNKNDHWIPVNLNTHKINDH